METLIIEVDCRSSNKTPAQLGITVEAPLSQQRALQHRKQQAALSAAKDYSNHGYQNLANLLDNNSQKHSTNSSPQSEHDHKSRPNLDPLTVPSTHQEQNSFSINGGLEKTVKHGLQITQIQEGSVIDRNGKFRIGDIIIEVNNTSLQLPFADAQKTLKEFVVYNSIHGPLRLKVLRRFASSSSSLPSTNGSQTTVIERNGSVSDKSKFSPVPKTQQPNPKQTKLYNDFSDHQNSTMHTSRHLGGPLNTRKIGTKHNITLAKGKDGFGIKIAERDNMFGIRRPIYITAITTSGSAYRDARLKEGDMLLEINGIDLSTKTQPDVTKMLKMVRVGERVEFVVSRQENLPFEDYNDGSQHMSDEDNQNNCDNDTSLINLDDDMCPDSQTINNQFEKKVDSILDVPTVDGPGTYVYDIPLNDTKSAGLGLYLKYPNLNGKDLGIWIEKVITGGAAWKDGRLRPNDQILSINGIDLVGLSNVQASETLTAAVCRGIGPQATSSTIRLNIRRRDSSVVAKILHGTNNRIEHSDQRERIHDPFYSTTGKTVGDSSAQNLKQNRTRPPTDNNLSGSSNSNSQSDSGLSPQTQASNSLKLSSSHNERLEQSSSDKTNDNSSAISQVTDFTTVQIAENDSQFQPSPEPVATCPKSLHTEPTPSIQSWDDESIDNMTGEERFQRDGFGRQSISEKRHAQLLANCWPTVAPRATDTVRLARGRKVNESFRAAVDRSYENSFNHSNQFECQSSGRHSTTSNKGANSTTSTANDKKHLLNNRDGSVNANSKKSSLLTRFLKFGSMKRIRKKHVDKDAADNSGGEASPEPYSYSYETDTHAVNEHKDQSGNVVGYYTLSVPDGRARHVEYPADASGFRARVMTNEVGVKSSSPAHVEVVAHRTSAEQMRQAAIVGMSQSQSVVGNQAPQVAAVGAQVVRAPQQQIAYVQNSATSYGYPYSYPYSYGQTTGYRGTYGQVYGTSGQGVYGGYGTAYQSPGASYYKSHSSTTVQQPIVPYAGQTTGAVRGIGYQTGVPGAVSYQIASVPVSLPYQTSCPPAAVSYQTTIPQRSSFNYAGSSNYIVLKK